MLSLLQNNLEKQMTNSSLGYPDHNKVNGFVGNIILLYREFYNKQLLIFRISKFNKLVTYFSIY